MNRHIIFQGRPKEPGQGFKGEALDCVGSCPTLKLLVWGRALRQYFYKNFIDILYVLLSIFTYLYLAATIYVFFFQRSAPHAFAEIIETLSEPYLRALGVYTALTYVSENYEVGGIYKTVVTNALAALINDAPTSKLVGIKC